MNTHVLRLTALTLTTVWALFWTLFAAAEGITEHAWLPPLVAAVIFLGSLIVAWRWSLAGSALLLSEGLAVCLLYPAGVLHARNTGQMLFVLGTLALPPTLSGALLLLAEHYAKKHPAA